MTALRSPVNWIHVLSRKMQPRAKRIQRSLHYARRTVLTRHPPKTLCRGTAGRRLWFPPDLSQRLQDEPPRGGAVHPTKEKKLVESNYIGEPKLACGVQEHEDARTSHPCERRASHCKATCGGGRGKFW